MWGTLARVAKKGEEHLQGTEWPFSPGVFIPSKLPDGAWENGKARLTASRQVRLEGGLSGKAGRRGSSANSVLAPGTGPTYDQYLLAARAPTEKMGTSFSLGPKSCSREES